jgi:NADH-quinone oxidoreductase subunit G
MTFLGRSIDSELGNMIDPVPGRRTHEPAVPIRARAWELSRRRSISPHDSIGANLIVQVKNDRVLRVLPYENEAVN